MTPARLPTRTYRTNLPSTTRALIQTVDSNPACLGRRPTPNLSLSTRCRARNQKPPRQVSGPAIVRRAHLHQRWQRAGTSLGNDVTAVGLDGRGCLSTMCCSGIEVRHKMRNRELETLDRGGSENQNSHEQDAEAGNDCAMGLSNREFVVPHLSRFKQAFELERSE